MRKLRPSETVYNLGGPATLLSLNTSTSTDNVVMCSLKFALVLLFGVCLVAARPRYLAIPIDEIDIIELNPIETAPSPRIARQAEAYVPVALSTVHAEEVAPRVERSTAHILDYVDFGAQTGANGAFGWYADFPAHH